MCSMNLNDFFAVFVYIHNWALFRSIYENIYFFSFIIMCWRCFRQLVAGSYRRRLRYSDGLSSQRRYVCLHGAFSMRPLGRRMLRIQPILWHLLSLVVQSRLSCLEFLLHILCRLLLGILLTTVGYFFESCLTMVTSSRVRRVVRSSGSP